MSGNPMRKLPMAAMIYATGDILIKATNLLLLPILTRFLTPEDFGILASVTAFSTVLSLCLQLSLANSLMRFYPDAMDETERKNVVGTVALFTAAWALLIVLLLNLVGGTLLDHIYRNVRFEPYLRIGTWIAFLLALNTLPLTVVQMQQRPMLHRAFSLAGFFATAVFMLVLVVEFRMGATGGLVAQAAGAAVTAIPSLFFMRRHMNLTITTKILKTCLLFSLPLVLYGVSGWVMDTSNRVFIERYVGLGQLGLFNIGSQFAMILGFVLGAIGLALTPLFYETARLDHAPELLARFGLLYIACTLGLGLIVSVFSREAIQLFTQPAFHDAYEVVPVLTATQALTGVWQLIAPPVMLKQKTGTLAVIVTVVACLSFGLNMWLIPAYGIMGAALSPFIANVLLNLMVFVVSIRLYPVPYNYRRLGLVLLSAIGVYFAADWVATNHLVMSLVTKTLIIGIYPGLLLWFGILDRSNLIGLLRAETK
jgi:O-antigen/teichoic acid export membrane protein